MLKYWAWLTTLPQIDSKKIITLLSVFSTPEEIYFTGERELRAVLDDRFTNDSIRALSMKSLDRAEQVLEQCQRLHIRMVTIQDAEYPQQLRALDDAPGVLYVKGQLSMLAIDPAIGIVGTRDASAYGLDVAARFGYHLSKGGMTVVTGMALGIDAEANKGALRAGCPTVAVLGCGVDVVYPPKHTALYHDIVSVGAVISDYPPATPPVGEHFPRRNRLISGLSLGILVVEAPVQSGALITARHALEQGRDVYAIPGNIDAHNSAGCNRLIRDYATLVTRPSDILEEYAVRYQVVPASTPEHTPPMPQEPQTQTKPVKPTKKAPPAVELNPAQRKLVDVLREGPADADKLIRLSGLSTQEALAELTMLEIAGVITSNQGLYEMA